MPIALAIHGGCGVMSPAGQPEAEWAAARAALAEALGAGWRVLAGGGRALDAVEAAVRALEDSPHFNAGHGAALNAAGEHELDASIMDGEGRRAGAVIGVRRVRNPVRAARAVLEGGRAVILAGPAADAFAGARGLELVDPSWFTIPRQRDGLARMKARGEDGTVAAATEAEKHGTVGAVALDGAGHLAAATSTGGYTDKPEGRVGDSPIPGAGTYAEDGVCAVSGTGQGESLHPPRAGARSRGAHALPRRRARRGRGRRHRGPHPARHRRRPDRARRRGPGGGALQHRRHVPRLGDARGRGLRRDPRHGVRARAALTARGVNHAGADAAPAA